MMELNLSRVDYLQVLICIVLLCWFCARITREFAAAISVSYGRV